MGSRASIFPSATLAGVLHVGAMVSPIAYGRRETPALPDVKLEGELSARRNAAFENVLGRGDRYNAESFRASASGTPGALWWDWPGDQVGRWLSVLSVAEACGRPGVPALRALALDQSLLFQSAQGCFGPERPLEQKDARIPSGAGFALRGMMDAYADTGDRRCLLAARRLAEYFEKTAPTWETAGRAQRHVAGLGVPGEPAERPASATGCLHEFYGHCLDGLVALYSQAGDRRALALAQRLARRAGRTSHAHHSLSLIRGLIDLHQATGDPTCLDPARDYLAWCKAVRLVDGAISEGMPRSEQDEGCALADYVIVNLMMFHATGEDEFLDDAEHVLVNHFAMNQFCTGGFGHRGYDAEVVGGKVWQGWDGRFGSENPGCCSLWGAWALGQLGRYIITHGPEGYEVNLYPEATVAFPERGVRLEITSDYPRLSCAGVAVECSRARTFAVRLRAPAWAESVTVLLNGKKIKPRRESGRLVVSRRWKSGDVLQLVFDGGLRIVPAPNLPPGKVALFDGPLCLALSSADADVSRAWRLVTDADGRPLHDGGGRFQLDDGERTAWLPLSPVGDDWTHPDVFNPHRLRIVFDR
ncbi:glycoside hydrolase family 127 protein [bacterium]|nr:glycoside hydrolase family 127 protein [bacterium]